VPILLKEKLRIIQLNTVRILIIYKSQVMSLDSNISQKLKCTLYMRPSAAVVSRGWRKQDRG
jgi:hypothetical protein